MILSLLSSIFGLKIRGKKKKKNRRGKRKISTEGTLILKQTQLYVANV